MPHVRIERLGARHRQKHGAERDERQPLVRSEQGESIARIERPQNVRRVDDLNEAQNAENDEPSTSPARRADRCCRCRGSV